MRRLVSLAGSAAAFIALAGASGAQGLPPCTVGLHVAKAGGTNAPGTITDADEAQGSYRVRYDNSTSEDWMSSAKLKWSCIGAPSGAKDIGFYAGTWDDNLQRRDPELVIGADGTYEWITAADPSNVIAGRWQPAEAGALGSSAVGPGLVLMQGAEGRDWTLESTGDVDGDNREIILARAGTSYFYFFRMR